MYLSLKLESGNCPRIITPFAAEKNGDELKRKGNREEMTSWHGGTTPAIVIHQVQKCILLFADESLLYKAKKLILGKLASSINGPG